MWCGLLPIVLPHVNVRIPCRECPPEHVFVFGAADEQGKVLEGFCGVTNPRSRLGLQALAPSASPLEQLGVCLKH